VAGRYFWSSPAIYIFRASATGSAGSVGAGHFHGFGKWIYFSSVVYFLSTQSDRFLLGRYLDMIHLGVYGTATVLSGALLTVVLKINSDVLYPAYAKVVQDNAARLRQVMLRTRFAIDAGMILRSR